VLVPLLGVVVLVPLLGVLEPLPVLMPPTPGPLPPSPVLPPNPVPGALVVIPRLPFVEMFRPKLVPGFIPELVPIPPVLGFPVHNDPGVAVAAPTLGGMVPGNTV
jgi:hypothetical protein